MSFQFSEIHNLVRTYQRVLKLEPADLPTPVEPAPEPVDRASISDQAQELANGSRRP